jgi:cellobiose phosphorylase
MNRAGKGGAGTSVWLRWLLITTIGMMAPLADRRDPARAGVEGGLLGLNRTGQVLTLAPCFPRHWPRLQASVRVGNFSFDSVIDNTAAVGTGIAGVTLDGVAQVQVNGIAALPLTGGGSHRVVLRLGPKAAPPVSFG